MLADVSIEDRYSLESGRVFLSGVQALVRLPLMQRQRDVAAGLNTAGFISGYRGSPLGGYDLSLWRAKKFLDLGHIHFQPGLNEDLAATAVWGSQQLGFIPGAKYDGVFAIWYGKGPGVDRSGDPLKHGNLAGAAQYGGVLVVCGDDHPGKSSTTAHQSEHALAANGMPVLYPASVQEYLDLGLYGWALSRYSGLWVGFKCINETVESTASVDIGSERVKIVSPEGVELPQDGVNIKFAFAPQEDDKRLLRYKIPLAHAFARANGLDRTVMASAAPSLGIVTAGKSYQDTLQALRLLGIDEVRAGALGICVYKVAMVWPLEPEGLRDFASSGVKELLFIEEKKAFLEDQAARILYNLDSGRRPRIVGKTDESGVPLLPADVQLEPTTLAQVIAARLKSLGVSDRDMDETVSRIQRKIAWSARITGSKVVRMPYFCSGCPHNRSTRVPEGSVAMSGIGCHTMAIFMGRDTTPPTQMGGEGLNWTGIAPFTETNHVFQNLGDGTYFHSGLLAIRAAVAAGVNVTYKILYNDAVAMTGGQPVEGQVTVADISRQVAAERVRAVAVVSDEPDKYGRDAFGPEVQVYHRDRLEELQRRFRDIPGTTVIIYDQTCAAEKRRRRKRQQYPDPPKRVFINEAVCEGCGDCSVKSNCVSIQPKETEFGRKRQIDQSSCNKDYSCVNGFCPAFVTVHGAGLSKPSAADLSDDIFNTLPPPELPSLDAAYAILVTGIGGTGVITVGAILGMAAHLEGKETTVFDMTGLAQKGGAVMSHLRIAERSQRLPSSAIALAEADLVLGCDLVVTGSGESLRAMDHGRTRAVVNSHIIPTAAFQLNADLDFRGQDTIERIREVAGSGQAHFIDATGMAQALTGNTIAANLFMVGYAYQLGVLPLSDAAIERAVELNKVAVEFNKRAFRLGRLAAHKPAELQALLPERYEKLYESNSLDGIIQTRLKLLEGYQDGAYAKRYEELVRTVERAEKGKAKGKSGLAEAVARYYSKLMAYKDEYEVARLYTNGDFEKSLAGQFEGSFKLKFHLAPPILARHDPVSGELIKREFGVWVYFVFRLLAKLKFLRGTRWDIFGRSAERRMERGLIENYESAMREVIGGLSRDNHTLAIEIASIPEAIRGFGHVKERHVALAKKREQELFQAFRQPQQQQPAA